MEQVKHNDQSGKFKIEVAGNDKIEVVSRRTNIGVQNSYKAVGGQGAGTSYGYVEWVILLLW